MRKQRRKSSPFIIGLTGSIGMGKTTVARMFIRQGVAACDSDAIVHKLMEKGGKAVEAISKLFPAALKDGGIDRQSLGREVFGNSEKLAKLEAILHPLVVEGQREFIKRARLKGIRLVVLDIPLLFETGAEKRCHNVVVVTAPAFIQRQRVLARPRMTEEKFANILARQMPDREKRRRADRVIDTGLGKARSAAQVKKYVCSLNRLF